MNTCLIKIKFNYDHWWWQVKVSSLQESFPFWFAETLPRDTKLPIKEKRAEKLICFYHLYLYFIEFSANQKYIIRYSSLYFVNRILGHLKEFLVQSDFCWMRRSLCLLMPNFKIDQSTFKKKRNTDVTRSLVIYKCMFISFTWDFNNTGENTPI